MTHDEIIAVVQAHKEGKEIEREHKAHEEHWVEDDFPSWNFVVFNYRIKPEPTLREWKQEEVPLDAWFKNKAGKAQWRITGFDPTDENSMVQINDAWRSAEELKDNWLHSFTPFDPDSWLPCGVRGEQQ